MMASRKASLAIRPMHGAHASIPFQSPEDDAVKPQTFLPSRYDEVHALMIDWEDAVKETPDFRKQKKKLAEEFDTYLFKPESFEIPSTKPYQALLVRIQQFLSHDHPKNLLIIYYGGHGANNKDKDHIWYCCDPDAPGSSANPNPKVNWTSIQGIFQDDCEAHVLFILDCCYSAAVARYVHASSTVEAIVAAGFERVAPLRGAHSFTMSLCRVLKEMRESEAAAYADVVCRMVSARLNRTDPATPERSLRATPHHIPFSNKVDKILISVVEKKTSSPAEKEATPSDPGHAQSSEAIRGPTSPVEPVPAPLGGEVPLEEVPTSRSEQVSSAPLMLKRSKKPWGYGDNGDDDIPMSRPRRTYTSFSARLDASILDRFPTDPESYGVAPAGHSPYRPLRADQIRLLHLHPSWQFNGPLYGHLTVGSFFAPHNDEELPEYEAVDKFHTKIIWVDHVCAPKRWDGIPQQEANHQLKLLPKIFKKATAVIVWLGEEDDQSETAMNFVEQVADLNRLDEVIKSDDTPQKWDTLVSLMRRPWFSHRWVFQEIIVARRAFIFCGSRHISWDTFSDAITFLETCFDEVQYRLKRQEISDTYNSSSWRHKFSNLVDLRALEAYSVINAGKDLFRRKEDGSLLSTCSLEALVSALPALQSANPQDIIYSLFPISADNTDIQTEETFFALNEDKDKSEVFQNFVRYCVETSKSLDIICRPWAPNQDDIRGNRGRRPNNDDDEEGTAIATVEDRIPSWICQVRNLPFGHRRKNIYGRKNGDVLVGHPNRRIYNASRRSAATPLFGRSQPNGKLLIDGTMVASGFRLGDINEIGFRAAAGTIYMEWIEMCDGWTPAPKPAPAPATPTRAMPYGDRRRPWSLESTSSDMGSMVAPAFTTEKPAAAAATYVPDHLWRTLVADRGPNGTPDADLVPPRLPRDQHPSTALDYIQRVQSVIWDRRLFKIHRLEAIGRALYGLAPRGAREGDAICILHGCSVPVVLRAIKSAESRTGDGGGGSNSNSEHKGSWELIGECFVYGMMDGEAMEVEGFLKGTREFEIC
ncbi:hypothetical protein PG990_001007 [Apiospora arundinis]